MTLETHNHTAGEPCETSRTPLRDEACDNGIRDHMEVYYERIGEFPLLTESLEAKFASLICKADKIFQEQVKLLERATLDAISGRNCHRTEMMRALNEVNDLVIRRERRNSSGDGACAPEGSSRHVRAEAALDRMILDACEASRTINKWAGLKLPRGGLVRRLFAVMRAREMFRNTTATSDGEKAGALAAISQEAFRILWSALPRRHPSRARMDKMDERFADELAADGECGDYIAPLLHSGALERSDLDTPRRVLFSANLRLVADVAKTYVGRGLDFDDLIAQGNLGLFRAVNAYDPERRTRFSTFAYLLIKQTITAYLCRQSRKVHLPSCSIIAIGKWRMAESRLQNKLGRPPNEYEMQDELGLTDLNMKAVRAALAVLGAQYHSIGYSVNDDDVPKNIATSREPDALDTLERNDDLALLQELLPRLSGREEAVIRLRFGLDGSEPMTLQDVARNLGLSRAWIGRIEHEALSRMRDAMLGKADDR